MTMLQYYICLGIVLTVIFAERRERSERSEANNRVLFEIPRYLYIYNIYIYMSVCTCIAQDRAHLTQVLVGHCALEHWLLFGAPL